jgi:hypothetical protein
VPTSYTPSDILAALDEARPLRRARPCFPQLDEAYVSPVDVRLTAYRDERAWAIVIERLGFNPRGVGHNGITVDLYFYGTGTILPKDRYGYRRTSIHVTDDGPDGPTFDGIQDVRPDVRSIRIRGKVIPVRTDAAFYAEHGVDLEIMSKSHLAELIRSLDRRVRSYAKHPPARPLRPDYRDEWVAVFEKQADEYRGRTHFMGHHLLRGLLSEHRESLLASDEERRSGLSPGLPQFLQLNEWQHPDILNRELPSETESFVLLAESMAAGDTALYRPTIPPNTHWANWPEGGSL